MSIMYHQINSIIVIIIINIICLNYLGEIVSAETFRRGSHLATSFQLKTKTP